MSDLVLIKLGGSAITHKDQAHSEDLGNIRRMGQEIKEALAVTDCQLILGTGGGSFAHQVADQYKVNMGLYLTSKRGREFRQDALKGFTLTQNAAAELNRIVVTELLQLELPVISMQPSAFLYCDQGDITEVFVQPLQQLLSVGIIPVVYGDVVTDLTKGCTITSTEQELVALAGLLQAKRLIICTDVDGVFTDDPIANPEAE
ncbi:MAG TPA: isopentenyl phosphate kinase, partial [Candidatus Lokiarchaeia archaeon]|nr:isopentenyl phosphate kinase [Candidatus Lokiarchaeia archaeon]